MVEAQGNAVAEALSALGGVVSHRSEQLDDRVRVTLESEGDGELRPEIFRLATERGWTLWELHRERKSLEQVFRHLTSGDEAPSPEPGTPRTEEDAR